MVNELCLVAGPTHSNRFSFSSDTQTHTHWQTTIRRKQNSSKKKNKAKEKEKENSYKTGDQTTTYVTTSSRTTNTVQRLAKLVKTRNSRTLCSLTLSASVWRNKRNNNIKGVRRLGVCCIIRRNKHKTHGHMYARVWVNVNKSSRRPRFFSFTLHTSSRAAADLNVFENGWKSKPIPRRTIDAY